MERAVKQKIDEQNCYKYTQSDETYNPNFEKNNIKVFLEEGAKCPKRQTPGSAGFDLYSQHDYIIQPNGRLIVKTGVSIELPKDTYARIEGRSGLTVRGIDVISGDMTPFCIAKEFSMAGDEMETKGEEEMDEHTSEYSVKVGIIDSDYRGTMGVTMENKSPLPFHISKGDRIAQLVIGILYPCELDVVSRDSMSLTLRNANGWGSTGK